MSKEFAMKQHIKEALAAVEREFEVKILYAWGTER